MPARVGGSRIRTVTPFLRSLGWMGIKWVFQASSEASLLLFATGEAPSRTLVETAKEAKEKAKETALAATEKAKDLANKAATKQQQQLV